MEKVLLVTISIGKNYTDKYNQLYRRSQENYAKKCGYDFKVIEKFLDNETNNNELISFQKILVCNQSWSYEYNYIIFVDADILINIASPPIHICYDYGDNVGIVDEYSQPTKKDRIKIQKDNKWEDTAKEYYNLCDLDIETDMVFNTGVMVFQPTKHRDLLKNIYDKYKRNIIGHYRGFHYEQSSIGYELQVQKKYIVMDNIWNSIWFINKEGKTLQSFFDQTYFIHFAGHYGEEEIGHLFKK